MNATLLVFLGAGIGGAMRYGVNIACLRWLGPAFPAGTMLVNVAGSFLMGVLAGWLVFRAGDGWALPARLFAMTGVLGGFTTFSAFSLDAVLLWERGQTGAAAFYVLGSVILSVGALVAGLALARTMT